MTKTISYINNALKDCYPDSEIKGFIHLIMERVCGLQPYQLLLGKGNELSNKEKIKIEEIVERLKKSEPIQYILGIADFYGYEFIVTPSVLIPRPETAELVDLIVKDLATTQPLRLLDIGTGSGCIAISLAKQLKQTEVYAADISEESLAVAKQNAAKLDAPIKFIQTDILSATSFYSFRRMFNFFSEETKNTSDYGFNIIVSNPPYIMEDEKAEMDANVLDYEPHLALFVPNNDPLRFYRAIARFGKRSLAKDGFLYFEINAQCGNITKEMLSIEGYKNIELKQDFYGKSRIIKAQI